MRKLFIMLSLIMGLGCRAPVPVAGVAAQGVPIMSAAPAPTKVAKKDLGFYRPDPDSPMVELKEFDSQTVAAFVAKLKELDGKSKEVWVRLNTNGGSISGGQEVIHALEAMKSYVVCVADFKAYSMGAYVLESQGCDWRLMTKRGSLMMHEPAVSEVGGNAGELRDYADLLDALNEGFLQTAAARMRVPVEVLRAKVTRRVFWMDWKVAQEWRAIDGFVDPPALPAVTTYEIKKSFLQQLLGG